MHRACLVYGSHVPRVLVLEKPVLPLQVSDGRTACIDPVLQVRLLGAQSGDQASHQARFPVVGIEEVERHLFLLLLFFDPAFHFPDLIADGLKLFLPAGELAARLRMKGGNEAEHKDTQKTEDPAA